MKTVVNTVVNARAKTAVASLAALLLSLQPAAPQTPAPSSLHAPEPIIAHGARILPTPGAHGMVVAQERRAAQIGVDILRRGGNAFDAAAAVGFALAVTFPRAGNLGGGGFMVGWRAGAKQAVSLDFRETAPAAAHEGMFLRPDGEPDPAASRDGPLAVAVPGSVAGLLHIGEVWGSGRISRAEWIAPAEKLAREGFPVEDDLADSLPRAAARLGRFDASRAIFLRPDGAALRPGDMLVQTDLARTLSAISERGRAGFYEGRVAQAFVKAVREAGGVITREDLAGWRPVERAPLEGAYRGRRILAMAPPSSGGVHLIGMLNVLEHFPLRDYGAGSAAAIHVMTETMKFAFADRAHWLGDPGFVPEGLAAAPLRGLLSKAYGAKIAGRIDASRATPADAVASIDPAPYESDQTTHFSIVDAEGNAVSLTTTLNFSYGLGMVAAGTGVLLNNEMDDFAARAGAANAFGLVGGARNLPAPGKRPLSSMTPTLALKDGEVEIVAGSPGGPRIITVVLETLVDLIDHDLNVAEAMVAPRFHHQWKPDILFVERGFSPDTLALLRGKGHRIVETTTMGAADTIRREGGLWFGAADTRQRGAAAIGY